jgi:mono/diheme cytochrome c family protein
MTKQISVGLGVSAVAVLASMMMAVMVSAQQGPSTHGVPTPEKVYGDGKTVPIKVTTREYDEKLLLSGPILSEEASTGRALWLQKCAYCHDGVGQPTYKTMWSWLGAETVQTLGEASVKAFINAGAGRMPGFRYGLDSQQIDDLIAFLKTVSSDQKPTPEQLSGRARAESSD